MLELEDALQGFEDQLKTSDMWEKERELLKVVSLQKEMQGKEGIRDSDFNLLLSHEYRISKLNPKIKLENCPFSKK